MSLPMNSMLKLETGQLAYLQEPFLLVAELAEHEVTFLLFTKYQKEWILKNITT